MAAAHPLRKMPAGGVASRRSRFHPVLCVVKTPAEIRALPSLGTAAVLYFMSTDKPILLPRHSGSDGAKPTQIPAAASSTEPKAGKAIGTMFRRVRHSTAMSNFGWLAADRGIRLLLGVFVGSWVARYLGREDFGLLSYALAFAGVFAALAPLGLEAIAVREIIRDPNQGGKWVGTVVGFRAAAALIFAFVGSALILVLRPHDFRALWLIAILGAGAIFQALDSGELWFQAHAQMRRLVLPRLILLVAMNGLKVGAILAGAGVLWFALLTVVEQAVSGGLSWIFARRALGVKNPPVFEIARGWRALRVCWPLAASALAVVLYMKSSQLVVGQMMGDSALAIYAAAARVPDAALFVPMILASSLLPWLLRSQAQGAADYRAVRLRYFRLNALLGWGICLPLCVGAAGVVELLFGTPYREAGPVMAVYVWSLLFVFLGVARAQHLYNENRTHISLWYSLVGLAVNLLGCLLLIPRWGAMGAAVATVLSQMASAFLSSFLHRDTREIGREQWLALITPWRIRSGRTPPATRALRTPVLDAVSQPRHCL